MKFVLLSQRSQDAVLEIFESGLIWDSMRAKTVRILEPGTCGGRILTSTVVHDIRSPHISTFDIIAINYILTTYN